MESKFRAKTNAIIARNKSSYYYDICALSFSYFLIIVCMYVLINAKGGREGEGAEGFPCPKNYLQNILQD